MKMTYLGRIWLNYVLLTKAISTIQEVDIPEDNRAQSRKIDAQLCSVLWQSVDPKTLHHLRPIKLATSFGLRPKDYTTMHPAPL